MGVVSLVIPRLFPDVRVLGDRISVQQGTDYAYINQMAEEAGYVFYVDPGPLPGTSIAYWGPGNTKLGIPQFPALNLDFDGHRNVDLAPFGLHRRSGRHARGLHPAQGNAHSAARAHSIAESAAAAAGPGDAAQSEVFAD